MTASGINAPMSAGIDKRKIVNVLFMASFPVYGIGNYISATQSPSLGYLVSISTHLLILVFYFLDILYQGNFRLRLNHTYLLMLAFLLSSVASLLIALQNKLPEVTTSLTVFKALLLVIPFHAFIVVMLYNERRNQLLRLTITSLTMLLAINLMGFYLLGLTNEVHSIEGRVNFPFLDGFYSGACLLAIINLLLVYYLKQYRAEPLSFTTVLLYFIFNLVLFFLINSRLTILVFVLVFVLLLLGMLRVKGLFLLSMFTVPILMVSGTLIYQLLQLPGLTSILKRVDVEDVTTFNGRAFLWRDALDWLMYDQRGIILGNGYKGHYFLDLISDVAKLWNEKNVHHMHLHSTSLEILVSQGLLFFVVFAILFYQIYRYHKSMHLAHQREGAFLPVVIFLLFLLQVDGFVYVDSLGFVIFSLLVANIAIQKKQGEFKSVKMDGSLLEYVKLRSTYHPGVLNIIDQEALILKNRTSWYVR